jgi:hypothetical protein
MLSGVQSYHRGEFAATMPRPTAGTVRKIKTNSENCLSRGVAEAMANEGASRISSHVTAALTCWPAHTATATLT